MTAMKRTGILKLSQSTVRRIGYAIGLVVFLTILFMKYLVGTENEVLQIVAFVILLVSVVASIVWWWIVIPIHEGKGSL